MTEATPHQTLVGRIALDTNNPYERTAFTDGTVMACPFAPGTWVERGDVVLFIAGESLRGAQELFLWYEKGGLVDPGVFGQTTWQARLQARERLKAWRFSESQIKAIARGRKILDPVPILAPASGRLLSVYGAGVEFAKDDILFRLAHLPIAVCKGSDAEGARFIPGQSVVIRAKVFSEKKTADTPERRVNARVRTIAPSGQIVLDLLGKVDDLAFDVPIIVQLPPEIPIAAPREAAWPYTLPPRGAELHGRSAGPKSSEDPPILPSLACSPVTDLTHDTRWTLVSGGVPRPSREMAPYELPVRGPDPGAGSKRFTLPLPLSEWKRLVISTDAVVPRRFHPVWHCTGIIEAMPAPRQAVCIAPPVEGFYTPPSHALSLGDYLPAGSNIGMVALSADLCRMQADYLAAAKSGSGSIEALRSALLAAGLLRADLARLDRDRVPIATTRVFTTFAGCIDALTIEPRQVSSKSVLVTLAPTNGLLVRCQLAIAALNHLPARVSVRVRRIGAETEAVLMEEQHVPITEIEERGEFARLALPLPLCHEAGLSQGHAVSVIIAVPDETREGLSVPRDAIASVLLAKEVLVHTGPGGLTPRSILTGLESEDATMVEVVHGLRAGDRVVRDLVSLRDAFDPVRAILDGFWDPAVLTPLRLPRMPAKSPTNPLLIGGRPDAG